MIEIMDTAALMAKEVLDGVDYLNIDLAAVIFTVEAEVALLDMRE
jgi:hypothetical protein